MDLLKAMKCPKCDGNLRRQDIFKYTDSGGARKVGEEIYCKSPGCNFQKDIKITNSILKVKV